jgi:hypothetical protein
MFMAEPSLEPKIGHLAVMDFPVPSEAAGTDDSTEAALRLKTKLFG